MSLFPSFSTTEDKYSKLDKLQQGSLFHTIEYELSDIVNKIDHIDTLNDTEIKNIIIRQHSMILNYDLFLMYTETRAQAQKLFTNKKFLLCFLDVIRLLDLTQHEKICINKLAYDYYIIPNKDQEISRLLYQLTTEVNGKEVIVLSSVLGVAEAKVLAMIRNSSFKEEKCIHRVNTYIIRSDIELSIKDIVVIYCALFERFTRVFLYTMFESKPNNLTVLENKKFDYISAALLEMLDSLPSVDIRKVLNEYAFTLKMIKVNTTVRFAIKSVPRYARIISILKEIEISDNIIIP